MDLDIYRRHFHYINIYINEHLLLGSGRLIVKVSDLYLKLITPNDLDLRAGAVAILIAFVRFSVSEFTDSSP